MKRPKPIRVVDVSSAEEVRRSHHDAIEELQGGSFASAQITAAVSLVDGVATAIPHTLGRPPLLVLVGIPVGAASAGYIVELRDTTVDRAKRVTLTAHGYGATIAVDVGIL